MLNNIGNRYIIIRGAPDPDPVTGSGRIRASKHWIRIRPDPQFFKSTGSGSGPDPPWIRPDPPDPNIKLLCLILNQFCYFIFATRIIQMTNN